MEQPVKQRLIGALVLALLAFIFLPMLVKGPDRATTDAAQVPIDMPKPDDGDFETRELTLDAPSAPAGSEGVLGLEPNAADAESQAATVTDTAPAEAPTVDASEPAAAEVTPTPVTTPSATQAPAPAEIKKPVPLPAVASGDWAVNVGSFTSKDSADALVRKLKADALPVMVERMSVNGASATRVRVGPYADRAVAEAARLRANAVSGGSAKIVALDAEPAPAPAVKPAATAAAKPAVATPPANNASGWAVQLAALSSESDANALRDRARAAGFASFVQKVQTDTGPRFRVRVGPEADKAAADRLRVAVAEKLGISDAVVRPHP